MVLEMAGAEKDQRYLLVRTGSLHCALPAKDVVRVVRGLLCYPVPGSKPRFLGLAQYGGEPLPVLDLHVLVDGSTSGTRHRSTVIVGRSRRRDRQILGLAVDEVVRVAHLEDIKTSGAESDLVRDVTLEGSGIKVVNTGRLLMDTSEESGKIDG
jgi:chemotaxis signal transduction protein